MTVHTDGCFAFSCVCAVILSPYEANAGIGGDKGGSASESTFVIFCFCVRSSYSPFAVVFYPVYLSRARDALYAVSGITQDDN